jgi:MFS family permease
MTPVTTHDNDFGAQRAGGGGSRRLFAQPVLRRLAVADVCARLPQGMVGLTLLLVAAQQASMTVAGLVVAGYTLGQAATGPLRGRLADRRGLVPVATVCAAGYALALAALLAGTQAAAPAGSSSAPRPWPAWSTRRSARACAACGRRTPRPQLTPTAFALDAAVFDLAYITGPVLASGLATGPAPAAAVAAAGAAGMHHAPFGKNDRRDRGGAVPWLPGPSGGQA